MVGSMLFALAMAAGPDAVPMSGPAAWYASIERFKDCSDYKQIRPTQDGRYELGDGVSDVEIPFPYSREAAFGLLLNTCEFTRAAGSARVPGRQVELANVLWRQPDAVAIFEDLFKRGNVPGRLHALVALYALDHSLYARRLAELSQEGSVVAQNGCVVTDVRIREIVTDIEKGILTSEYQASAKYMTWLKGVEH